MTPEDLDRELKLEHFKHLCEQTRHYNDKLTEAFTFFVTTLSAIVGGSVWLAYEKREITSPLKNVLVSLSNGLVVLLTIVTLVRVGGNFIAWYNIRRKQHEISNDVPAPHWFGSAWLEVGLLLAVCAALWFFIDKNPFSVLITK